MALQSNLMEVNSPFLERWMFARDLTIALWWLCVMFFFLRSLFAVSFMAQCTREGVFCQADYIGQLARMIGQLKSY